MANRTFFQKAQKGTLGFTDIFSDVMKKHTEEDTAQMFIAGTPLTTPSERDMLAKWNKPYAFARVFCWGVVGLLILYFAWINFQNPYALFAFLTMLPCLVPLVCLLFVWELHIPRNISLYEVLEILIIGGAMSLVFALFFFDILEIDEAALAGLAEEPAKLLVICLFLRKKNRNYILNGILIGFAVGAGFEFMESIGYTLLSMWEEGADYGINVGLLRAMNGIGSHGLYASLYGGALAWAKGRDDLNAGHLVNPVFLMYFGISIVLHAANNSAEFISLFPFSIWILPGGCLILQAAAVMIWFQMIKKGVNQIVQISLAFNNERLTYAVNGADPGLPTAAGRAYAAGSGAVQAAQVKTVYLVGISGDYANRKTPLYKGMAVRIGRDAQRASIAVPSCAGVSGLHCEVLYDGTHMIIRDLGSTNGTFVMGKRLVPQESVNIAPGSRFSLGDDKCSFIIIEQ